MNKLPNHMNLAAQPGPWKQKPTTIPKPSNSRSTTGRAPQAHASGSNPYNLPLQSKKSSIVGNPTSARTLIHSNSIEEGPPKKRTKYDHTFTTTPNSGSSQVKPWRSSGREVPRDITVIEDDEDDDFENDTSSQSLLLHQPDSPRSNHQTLTVDFSVPVDNSEYGPIGAGKNTQWVSDRYGNARNDEDSDPIETFSEPLMPVGLVKKRVDAFEAIESTSKVPKLDLTAVPKPTGKRKMKPKPQFNTNGVSSKSPTKIPVREAIPKKRKNIDRIDATPASTRDLGPVSLAEIIHEGRHISSEEDQKLQVFYNSSDFLLRINSCDAQVLDMTLRPKDSFKMMYSKHDSKPVIQILSLEPQSHLLLTMRFDLKNKKESIVWETIFCRLKEAAKSEFVQNPDSLWQTAQSDMAVTQKEDGTKTKTGQRNENRKSTSTSIDREARRILPRYTPENFRHDEPKEKEANESRSTSVINQTRVQARIAPRRSTRKLPPEKPVDQDKVILVYPQGVPGAVNISNGDLARLEPGEFLNDTLIEFGLKLWLKDLEAKNPELASQVHVFNSFFYKKLNNKKSDAAAFETVRKWTSKFDIFKKKYVIVPINEHMHWYLAIIYEPEHILSSKAADTPSPRKRTRLSVKAGDVDEKPSATTLPTSTNETTGALADCEKSVTSSEAEVERNLDTEFQSSCTIDVESSNVESIEKAGSVDTADKSEDPSSPALSYLSEPEDLLPPAQPRPDLDGNEISGSMSNNDTISSDGMDMDDEFDIPQLTDKPSAATSSGSATIIAQSASNSKRTLQINPISADSFYSKSKGKQKAKVEPISIDMDVDADGENDVHIVESLRKTYIFTFDSLGTNHPHAIKKLGQYLRMEAKDKKQIADAGLAGGKTALVPVQPNFCDCGVYLLHFAQTFLTDPSEYCRLILSQSKSIPNEDRQKIWNDHKVKDMRVDLSMQIKRLSKDWQKERISRDEDAKLQGVETVKSDSEIEMPTPVKKGRAVRPRG